jgi:hypothetical protein
MSTTRFAPFELEEHIWDWVKDHPSSSIPEVEEGLGLLSSGHSAAAPLRVLVSKKLMTMVSARSATEERQRNRYTVTNKSYHHIRGQSHGKVVKHNPAVEAMAKDLITLPTPPAFIPIAELLDVNQVSVAETLRARVQACQKMKDEDPLDAIRHLSGPQIIALHQALNAGVFA